MNSNHLIINDPVYGFTSVPRGLLCEVIAHPFFQRLSRIRQLGMAPFVYPGAVHTRAAHSIGAFHLMQEAFRSLAEKGVFLFDAETEAAEAAILLHDVGHGPFSHVLEDLFVDGMAHEDLSLLMMERINEDLHGAIGLAIKIFRDEYPKPFLRELICSQLDTDRLDYLCRDSFYTGVREGDIGAARIIKMMCLTADEHLAVHRKGLYSIENYLMARRLMYWQVYLHKTAIAAEELLRATLRRAMLLMREGMRLFASSALSYFLVRPVGRDDFMASGSEALDYYARLDDSDILCAIKEWQDAPDVILSRLARAFVTRRLPRVEEFTADILPEVIEARCREVACRLGITVQEASYFVSARTVRKEMYSVAAEGIHILCPDGEVCDVSGLSHIVRGDTIAPADVKHYLFVTRE